MMKKLIALCAFVLLSCTIYAQEKKFNYEFGINYSLGTNNTKHDKISGKVRGYFEMRRNILNTPFDVGFLLDFSTFERDYNDGKTGWTSDKNSFNVLAVGDYRLRKGKKVEPFAGAGLGVSFANSDTGIFNEGFKTNVCFMPRVGVRFFKHISFSADYMLTHKEYQQFHLRLGFFF